MYARQEFPELESASFGEVRVRANALETWGQDASSPIAHTDSHISEHPVLPGSSELVRMGDRLPYHRSCRTQRSPISSSSVRDTPPTRCQ